MPDIEEPTVDQDSALVLAGTFAATAQSVFSAGDPVHTLQRVVSLAVETIDGCDHAGVFILDGETVTTPALTDPIVAEVDTLQHRCQEGPCLDSIAGAGTVYAGDLATDSRWPHFGPEAAQLGIRSALAVRLLSADHTQGALNLYAHYPHAFGVIDRAKALILTGLAGVALSALEAQEDQERRSANLVLALATRAMIGQAQGILMERERISADQAFDVLRRASQHLNIKLRDVAQNVVFTGETPEI